MLTLKKSLCVLVCMAVYASGIHAIHASSAAMIVQQQRTINGKVTDEFGPVAGASVAVKGAALGTMTDLNGEFTINVQKGQTLVVSFLGYSPREILIDNQTVIEVKLSEDTQKLDEVVVTALGIKRQKRSLGYSTTQVGGDEFTQARDINMGNALSGKIAGVSVAGNATGTGGSSRVTIRGNASMTGNNQPLYVVDGVPYDNTNLGSAGKWGGLDMGDGLSNINADDIESIQVLKGAAASALYGYRGGNGAILITTKSGKKGKPLSIDFNNNLTFNLIYDHRDFQKTFGQGKDGVRPLSADGAKASERSSWGDVLDGKEAVNFLGDTYNYSYVDNWKHFYRTGLNNTTSIGFSGAGENIIYRFGVSNMYEKGILPNSGIRQQGISMNTTYDITNKLQLIVNANYVFEKSKGRASLSDRNDNTNASLLYHVNSFDVRWLKGDKDWGTDADGNELLGGTDVYFNNPYWLQYRKTNNMRKNRLTGGLTLKYDFTDWLYLQGAVTRDGYHMEFKQVQPMGAAENPGGKMTEYSKTFYEMNYNFLLGFNKTFNNWSVGATFGGNRQINVIKQWIADNVEPFLVPNFPSINNITNRPFTKYYAEYRVNSFYGTADLGYKNQLFLSLTGRNDWFSTLNPDNNSYFYPSVSLSWVFSDTFKTPDWFTFGKARLTYASASNGAKPYQNIRSYKLNTYVSNGQPTATVNNEAYPNANLKPVRISEWEGGLNLSFFDNRLSFDMAYYVKNTKDDIAQISISNASGFNSRVLNVGKIRNNGFEFMMNVIPVKTKDFMWNTTFNFAHNDSKVKYLGDGVESLALEGAITLRGYVSVKNIVGKPYGQLVGYKYKRHEGQIVFSEGVAQRSDNPEALGSGVYNLTGGWRNEFTYKDFSLAFLVDFKFGAKIYSGTNLDLCYYGLHKRTLQGRTPSNPAGSIIGKGVMLDKDGNYVANTVAANPTKYWQSLADNCIAEEFIYNAGFVKLREVSLGYNIPKSLLSKQSIIKGATISLVARNLWTIIKHTDNIDPEAAYNNSNGQGLELNGYPPTRSIGFNLNVKF